MGKDRENVEETKKTVEKPKGLIKKPIETVKELRKAESVNENSKKENCRYDHNKIQFCPEFIISLLSFDELLTVLNRIENLYTSLEIDQLVILKGQKNIIEIYKLYTNNTIDVIDSQNRQIEKAQNNSIEFKQDSQIGENSTSCIDVTTVISLLTFNELLVLLTRLKQTGQTFNIHPESILKAKQEILTTYRECVNNIMDLTILRIDQTIASKAKDNKNKTI